MTRVLFRVSTVLHRVFASLHAETVSVRYGSEDGMPLEIPEWFERPTTFIDRDPVTDVRDRRCRLRVRRTNDSFSNTATFLSLTLTGNGRAVATQCSPPSKA